MRKLLSLTFWSFVGKYRASILTLTLWYWSMVYRFYLLSVFKCLNVTNTLFVIQFVKICHRHWYWDHRRSTIDIWSRTGQFWAVFFEDSLILNFRWLFTSFTVCGILTAMVIVYHETDFLKEIFYIIFMSTFYYTLSTMVYNQSYHMLHIHWITYKEP